MMADLLCPPYNITPIEGKHIPVKTNYSTVATLTDSEWETLTAERPKRIKRDERIYNKETGKYDWSSFTQSEVNTERTESRGRQPSAWGQPREEQPSSASNERRDVESNATSSNAQPVRRTQPGFVQQDVRLKDPAFRARIEKQEAERANGKK